MELNEAQTFPGFAYMLKPGPFYLLVLVETDVIQMLFTEPASTVFVAEQLNCSFQERFAW